MSNQINKLQDMEKAARRETTRANQWELQARALKRDLTAAMGHYERANKVESQIQEMALAIEEAAQTAQKNVEEIKELQETNEVLLIKYQENERHLQRYLTRSMMVAPPPAPDTSKEEALQEQIHKLQEELRQEQLHRQRMEVAKIKALDAAEK